MAADEARKQRQVSIQRPGAPHNKCARHSTRASAADIKPTLSAGLGGHVTLCFPGVHAVFTPAAILLHQQQEGLPLCSSGRLRSIAVDACRLAEANNVQLQLVGLDRMLAYYCMHLEGVGPFASASARLTRAVAASDALAQIAELTQLDHEVASAANAAAAATQALQLSACDEEQLLRVLAYVDCDNIDSSLLPRAALLLASYQRRLAAVSRTLASFLDYLDDRRAVLRTSLAISQCRLLQLRARALVVLLFFDCLALCTAMFSINNRVLDTDSTHEWVTVFWASLGVGTLVTAAMAWQLRRAGMW